MGKKYRDLICLFLFIISLLFPTDFSFPSSKANHSLSPAEKEVSFSLKALASNEAIVNTSGELQTTLATDNGITIIYLGANITFSAVIIIHPNKKTVVIDGHSPLDAPGVNHTLTDNTKGYGNSIYINTNTGTKDLTVQNMNIVSTNEYGTFTVLEAATNVTMTYDHVNYDGPQITYNPHGTAKYLDSVITIKLTSGTDVSLNKIAITTNIVIGGNTSMIRDFSTASLLFWFPYPNPSFTVLPNANFKLVTAGANCFYNEHDYYPVFDIGEDATVNMNIDGSLFYGSVDVNAKNFIVRKRADVKITNVNSVSSRALIRLSADLTVEEGASLEVVRQTTTRTAPLFTMMGSNSKIAFNNPKRTVLYNENGSIFGWAEPNSGKISITSRLINYWNTVKPFSIAGTIAHVPSYIWAKADNTSFSISATGSNASSGDSIGNNTLTTDVTSNFIPGVDVGVQPAGTNFNLQNMKILSLSSQTILLDVDPVYENDNVVTGLTNPNTDVIVSYIDSNNDLVELPGKSDASGVFEIMITNSSDIIEGREITVRANSDFKTMSKTITVAEIPGIYFISVPQTLSFQTTRITSQIAVIPRKDPDWGIRIFDKRNPGARWALSVYASKPLKTLTGETIPNGLIFVDGVNDERIIGPEAIEIYRKTTAIKNEETVVMWDEQHGVLVKAFLPMIIRGHYSATLTWVLIDAP